MVNELFFGIIRFASLFAWPHLLADGSELFLGIFFRKFTRFDSGAEPLFNCAIIMGKSQTKRRYGNGTLFVMMFPIAESFQFFSLAAKRSRVRKKRRIYPNNPFNSWKSGIFAAFCKILANVPANYDDM